jgi:flagellar biosynthesis/type III secretory pathway protein FliH
MDGDFTSHFLDESNWVQKSRHARQPGGSLSSGRRASMFLQRDLSDEALQKPAEPLFQQAELAAARQEGFEAGHTAGVAAAASSQAAYRAAAEVHALEVISAAMKDGSQRAAGVADNAAAALAKAVVASMHAVMPDLIQRTSLKETGAMLGYLLPGLSREPAVRIEVPHEIAGYISATLASLAPEHHEKIDVIGKDNMGSGEARVHWVSGHARRQPAQIWQTVMEALNLALDDPKSKDSENGE